MNEIDKLYENAGIEPTCRFKGLINGTCLFYYNEPCQKEDCKNFSAFAKEFTAEKQIELIKFLIKDYNYYLDVIDANNFENSLAASLNDLWQDLTEEEKEQIRGILE